MASAFRQGLDAAPAEARDLVQEDQRQWLGLLPRYCPVPDPLERYESVEVCLLLQYRARIKELKTLVQRKGGVTFVQRAVVLAKRGEVDEDGVPGWEEMPGYGTLTASWPVAVHNSPEWRAWNEIVVDSAQRILSSGDQTVTEPSPAGWDVEADEDNFIEVTLGAVGPRLVTATIEGTWMRGAHPSESYVELNWLLQDRRELRPGDVFKPGSGWETLFQQRCKKYLNSYVDPPGSGTYYPVESKDLADTLHTIATDPRSWRIDGKGISIVLPEYAVAPRAMHPGPVQVPWADLKSFLRPDFPIPGLSVRP